MQHRFDKIFKNNADYLYFVFRVFVGFLFFQIGLQRLLLGGAEDLAPAVTIISLLGLVGLLELVGGLAIMLGVFTRPFALVSAVYMIVEYIKSHISFGILPLMSGASVEFLLFASFLVMLGFGAGKWSLERLVLKKEIF